MDASLDTLFLPLQNGDVPPDGRTLFIGARAHAALPALKADAWQPFKPFTDGLSGVRMVEDLPGSGDYDLVLVAIPKQVEEAKFLIASGLYALKEGGHLLLSAANDANGNRLEKWLKEIGLESGSLSKNKARSVWAKRSATIAPLAKDWHVQGRIQKHQIGDGLEFSTQPGLYGWDKIDAGSKILAGHLPSALKGTGADFGAGTGYLSYRLLQAAPSVSSLYIAEADARALACAKINLENVRGGCTLEYLWADLARPADVPPLDFIVMNPPFHVGKKTDIGLGQAFLDTAVRALKKGGKLYMVANAHLPYELILREKFASVKTLATEQGFKIIEAVK